MYWRMCYNVKRAKCRKDRKIMAVIYENKVKELGKDIIKNNKGDDYLQATVWNVFFFDNQKDMIDVIDKRKEEIGKILLDEIIIDLTKNKVAISKDFLEKLRRTYAAIDNKMNMRCKYEEFLEYGENEK